ncbi:MAG TPA: phosphoribosylformylglycinamidine synthase subunit PurL [Acidimicrobiales bacterium]|nr:phosphoribosylformylglycinamidine synthase subunit PurL [Acidimicrobiales bacterium]
MLHRALGLTDDEASDISSILGREPNPLELAMYAVMWSEHCSYKSSRLHLKRLPTEAPWVIVGPGENAGVVDVGDGIAVAIRIESHNHPSAIEPYQGAATGVGGILRDIFTMGARPIALMDPLRFGPLDDARSRWIAEGVVSGISGYGNAVGVPTVGGEVVFDATYQGNPLVNVLCLGVLPVERLVLGRASGVGNLAVLLGSSTGRDGIGGVSVLASAGFSEGDGDASKRPSVQVGDPFEEKRLIEACLALLDEGLVVGIQDLGGAGLTCATSETASRGGVGMDVDVRAVPCREAGMEPHEIMTSESQERMLAIVEPSGLDAVMAICERWEVRATVIGRVTDGGRLRILDGFDGAVLADVPAASLHDAAPLYDRPLAAGTVTIPARAPHIDDAGAHLLGLLADTAWVWSQYDHQLFLNTVQGPGGDATVLRLKHPATGHDTGRGLALTTDGNHRWCAADPRLGTAMVVAEAASNLACVGARPIALVNCLNFGNPEHPDVMWQLSEAIDGMAEACRAFDVPVVGGNVSLYNETAGNDIAPTPVVGMLGLLDQLDRRPPGARVEPGALLALIGSEAFDLASHRRMTDLVRELVIDELVVGAHDVADGGLALCLAEMSVVAQCGVEVAGVRSVDEAFVETPSRIAVCVATSEVDEVERRSRVAGVPCTWIGTAGGDRIRIGDVIDVSLAEAADRWAQRLPAAFGTAVTH